MNNKGRWVVVWVGLFLLITITCGLLIKGIIDAALYNRFPDRGVPRINIDLNGVSLDEIDRGAKDTKYEGNDLQIYDNGEILKYSGVEIKGRGNGTWVQDKKPYQIKFSNNTDVLSIGRTKKWILLANYYDHSYLRNDLSLTLAEMMGINYNNRGKNVELYFNGKYEGVYYLVQKVELAKGSVDLKNTNGLLFEIDCLHRSEEKYYATALKDCLVFKDAVNKDLDKQELLIADFVGDFQRAEVVARDGKYDEVAEIIDIESFAKYYLINEFTTNPDAYMSSFYLYRNERGKICAGPIWDFDYALGNREWIWQDDDSFFSPDAVEKNMNFKIMKYLSEIPEFKDEVKSVFQKKMMGREHELIIIAHNQKDMISKAVAKDIEKWGFDDFEDEASYLINWIKARYKHFESEYGEAIDRRRFRFL